MPRGSPSSAATRCAVARRTSRERDEARETDAPDEQMSLFAVISAVATDASGFDDLGHDELDDGDDDGPDELRADAGPARRRSPADGDTGTPGLTRREEKRNLRDENATVARELARRARLTHAQVNAELNRLSGVGKVSEATVEQLERRLVAADRWLAKT